MTDDDLDDLASAHLDGDTTPEEDARLAADPALRARVEALAAVRDQLRAAVPVDVERREVAIDAALAAFAATSVERETDAPTSLAAVASRRRRTPDRLRLLGAAAAIALLVALVPLVGRLTDSDSDDDLASESADLDESAGDGAEVAEDSTLDAPSAGAEPTTTARSARLDLGPFDDLDQLVAAVESPTPAAEAFGDAATPDATDATDAAGGAELGPECPAGAPAGTEVTVATATVDGAEVLVQTLVDRAGARTLRVLDAADCRLLLERPLR